MTIGGRIVLKVNRKMHVGMYVCMYVCDVGERRADMEAQDIFTGNAIICMQSFEMSAPNSVLFVSTFNSSIQI